LIADNSGRTFTVNAANGGTLSGDLGGTFANVENLTGGTGADTFQFTTGTLSGNINGAAGTDTPIADNNGRTFTVHAPSGGTLSGDLGGTFANVENLTGGTGADTFAFTGSGSVAGVVDGKGGSDTLDFSAVGSQAVVLTGTGGTDGFNGTDGLIGGGFQN